MTGYGRRSLPHLSHGACDVTAVRYLLTEGANCVPIRLADAATREGQSHLGYLEALLAAEMEEPESRAITRLLREARLPRMKTLDGFEFDRSGVSATQLRTLAEGDYVSKAEPVLLVGRLALAKPIWRRDCAWWPAVSGGGCGSPRQRR